MTARSFLHRFAGALLLLAASAAPVACSPNSAQTASAEQTKANITSLATNFKAAFEAKDYDKIVALSLPQPLVDAIMKQSGLDVEKGREQFKAQLRTVIEETLAQVAIIEASIDTSTIDILTSPTGRLHALLPAMMVMDVQGTRMQISNSYLALMEGDRWFLLDPSDANSIPPMRQAFPDLADLQFAAPKIEVISQ